MHPYMCIQCLSLYVNKGIGWIFTSSQHWPAVLCRSGYTSVMIPEPTCRSLLRMRPLAGKEPSPCWCLMSQDLAARSSSGSMKMKPRDWAKDFNTNAVSLERQQSRRDSGYDKWHLTTKNFDTGTDKENCGRLGNRQTRRNRRGGGHCAAVALRTWRTSSVFPHVC